LNLHSNNNDNDNDNKISKTMGYKGPFGILLVGNELDITSVKKEDFKVMGLKLTL
jgi:hypothetical protein